MDRLKVTQIPRHVHHFDEAFVLYIFVWHEVVGCFETSVQDWCCYEAPFLWYLWVGGANQKKTPLRLGAVGTFCEI